MTWACILLPPPGFIIVNLDGSSLENPGAAGYGGLLGHANGDWSMGFSGHVTRADNLCVKLLALRRDLIMAWSLGFHVVVYEVDCSEVVRLVLNTPPMFHV